MRWKLRGGNYLKIVEDYDDTTAGIILADGTPLRASTATVGGKDGIASLLAQAKAPLQKAYAKIGGSVQRAVVMTSAWRGAPPESAGGAATGGAGGAGGGDVDPSMLSVALASTPFTYIAWGDCKYGNPGHCMGDWSNLYIARTLLGFTREQTRAVLYTGFGGSAYSGGKKHETLSVVDRGQTDPRSHHPFFPEWQGLARTVQDSASLVRGWGGGGGGGGGGGASPLSPASSLSSASLRLLPVAAFSPLGAHGLHWKLHLVCGRSTIMRELTGLLQTHVMTRMIRPAFNRHNTDNAGCAWLRARVAEKGAATMQMWNEKACRSRLGGVDGAPVETGGNVITYLRRTGQRRVSNARELVECLGNHAFADGKDYTVLLVDPAGLSTEEQGMLVTLSSLVIGMHGGNMWNAGRWMAGTRQAMLEIMPIKGPSATVHLARGQGIHWDHLVCHACTPGSRQHVGAVPMDVFVRKVEAMLPLIVQEG